MYLEHAQRGFNVGVSGANRSRHEGELGEIGVIGGASVDIADGEPENILGGNRKKQNISQKFKSQK